MYLLTKEQRISNLEEIINQKNQKIERLQIEVQNLLKKLEKIKNSEELLPKKDEIIQDLQKDEPTRSTSSEVTEMSFF